MAKTGRPSLGDDARTEVLTIKLSRRELAAIRTEVERLNTAGLPTTVAGWVRDRAVGGFDLP